MNNEEKCNYVVLVFNGIIDGSDEFTDEEKKVLKEIVGMAFFLNHLFLLFVKNRVVRKCYYARVT